MLAENRAKILNSSTAKKIKNQINAQWVCSTEPDSVLWEEEDVSQGARQAAERPQKQRRPALGKLDAREALWGEGRSTPPFLEDVRAQWADSPPDIKPATQQPVPNMFHRAERALACIVRWGWIPGSPAPLATGLQTLLPVPSLQRNEKQHLGILNPYYYCNGICWDKRCLELFYSRR